MGEYLSTDEEKAAICGVVMQAEFDAEVERVRQAAGVGSAEAVTAAEAKASALITQAVTRGYCEQGGTLLPPEQVTQLHEANLKAVETEVAKKQFLSDAGEDADVAAEQKRLTDLKAYVNGA